MAQDPTGPSRLRALRRDDDRVTPLELFFDLVFVLAITQCTTVMVGRPSWEGIGQALLLLGILWWAWVGYAWLTSVVDPEEGSVQLVMFVAMAAFLVAALAVPEAFGDEALTLAVAYGVVRVAHIALFMLASREELELRRSVLGLAGSTLVAVALLVAGASASGGVREGLWGAALLLDMAGPYFFGAAGWQLVPGHFAERHGLIVIIALGESVVAIGVGAGVQLSSAVIVGAVLGVVVAVGLWWEYFDVSSIVAARRLSETPAGRARNELARDAYSYLHFPMVAGVVLVAYALKTTLAHVDQSLAFVPATALAGGVSLYLLALVGFKRRAIGIWSIPRVVVALILVALLPAWTSMSALAALVGVATIVVGLVVYETVRFADARSEERGRLHEHD